MIGRLTVQSKRKFETSAQKMRPKLLTGLFINPKNFDDLSLGKFECYTRDNMDIFDKTFATIPPRAVDELVAASSDFDFDLSDLIEDGSMLNRTFTRDLNLKSPPPPPPLHQPISQHESSSIVLKKPHSYIEKLRNKDPMDIYINGQVENSCRYVVENIYTFIVENIYTEEALSIANLCKDIYLIVKGLDISKITLSIIFDTTTQEVVINICDSILKTNHWNIVVYYIAMMLPRHYYMLEDSNRLIFQSTDDIYQFYTSFISNINVIQYFSDK